jgi:hypothetical protein
MLEQPVSIKEEFDRDGYVVLRGVLTSDELALMEHAAVEAASLNVEQREGRLFHGEIPPATAALHSMPTLVRLVQQLIGEDVALYLHRFLVKDALWSDAVQVHQDVAFSHGGVEKVHVFMAFNHVDETNGGLAYWKGSHRFGLMGQGEIKTHLYPNTELSPVIAMDPGDVVLMDNFTWHESPPSQGLTPRYLYQATYQPSSDGSYALFNPKLVSGKWKTDSFHAAADANMTSAVSYWINKYQDTYAELNELKAAAT